MTQPIETRMAQEASELDQARALFQSIHDTLHGMLETIRGGDLSKLKEVSAKQAQLQDAAIRAAKLKEQFDAKHGHGLGEGEFDLDRARFEIGCKLARLRTTCDAGRLSCELDGE